MVKPLASDRLHWTAADYRFAAAILGDEMTHLLYVVKHCTPCDGLRETERIAIDHARIAGHYANRALNLEDVTFGTIGLRG
jgi:hypothetical protein